VPLDAPITCLHAPYISHAAHTCACAHESARSCVCTCSWSLQGYQLFLHSGYNPRPTHVAPYVARHNGTGWVYILPPVDEPYSSTSQYSGSFAIDSSGSEGGALWLGLGTNGTLSLLRYNATLQNFTRVSSLSLAYAPFPPFALAFNASGVAHVAFQDSSQGERCSVLAVDPNTGAFTYLGGPGEHNTGKVGCGRTGQGGAGHGAAEQGRACMGVGQARPGQAWVLRDRTEQGWRMVAWMRERVARVQWRGLAVGLSMPLTWLHVQSWVRNGLAKAPAIPHAHNWLSHSFHAVPCLARHLHCANHINPLPAAPVGVQGPPRLRPPTPPARWVSSPAPACPTLPSTPTTLRMCGGGRVLCGSMLVPPALHGRRARWPWRSSPVPARPGCAPLILWT